MVPGIQRPHYGEVQPVDQAPVQAFGAFEITRTVSVKERNNPETKSKSLESLRELPDFCDMSYRLLLVYDEI